MKCREREATRSRCRAVPRSRVTPRPFSSSPRSQVHEAHTSARIPSAVLMSKPSSSSRTTVGRTCPAGELCSASGRRSTGLAASWPTESAEMSAMPRMPSSPIVTPRSPRGMTCPMSSSRFWRGDGGVRPADRRHPGPPGPRLQAVPPGPRLSQRMTLAAAYALAHPGRSGAPRILRTSAKRC